MRQAFTLVELAIVLVIIGLLVGGVLVGQDLIKSAGINAVVSDMQAYEAAAVTFRDKYAGIPGDLRNDKAAQGGLTVSVHTPGTFGEGDGDGLLVNGQGTSTNQYAGLGGETTLFWRQLSDTGLISFTSNSNGALVNTTNFGTGATTLNTLTGLLPALRLRPSVFIHAYANNGRNYYQIASWNTAGNANGALFPNAALTPREALGIDQKVDDGYPATGTVISSTTDTSYLTAGLGNGGTPSTANTVCYDTSVTPNIYATGSSTIAEGMRCALRLKTVF